MGEKRLTETQYDWVKGLPTLTIQDPGGLTITTSTGYDAQGRVTSQVLPGGMGGDAASRITEYWSATGTGWCKGRPEWADQPCWTGPAGDITGGGSHPAKLPNTTTEYDRWGNRAVVTDEVGGVSRTTATTYDAAGRKIYEAVTGGIGQAVPAATTEYDPATGAVVKVSSPTGGTITSAYDLLGRLISYTDADGGVTRTEYDLLDRKVKESDSVPTTVTYTYDHTAEPRGLLTAKADSVAGTFRATYDADGSAATEKLPGGYTLRITGDTTGTAVNRTYTRDSDDTTVFTDSVTRNAHGQVGTHAGWSEQRYHYDRAARLTGVEDNVEGECTRRTYTLDRRSNRTSLATAVAAPGADCPAGGGTTVNHRYDSADRLVDAGYGYDAFGRTTALTGTTVGYYANDLVHRQTADGRRQTWELDASLRLRSWKVETGSGSTWTPAESKVNHYDSDGDNPRWIVEDTTTGALTRNVESAAGDLGATTEKTGGTVLQLSTLHGDIALQLPLNPEEAPTVLDADEYGNARQSQEPVRYGWLGAKQRSTETLTGLTLMGVRLYNPATGRFLSSDPVYGGSANAYEYGYADPVNKFDLDGKWVPLVVFGVRAAIACYRYCKKTYKAAKYAYRGYKWGKSMRRARHVGNRKRGRSLVRGVGCAVAGYGIGAGVIGHAGSQRANVQRGWGYLSAGVSLGLYSRIGTCQPFGKGGGRRRR